MKDQPAGIGRCPRRSETLFPRKNARRRGSKRHSANGGLAERCKTELMSRRFFDVVVLACLCAGVVSGCTSEKAGEIFDESQLPADSLPVVEGEMFDHLDPATARYLGGAEDTRYWAVRDDDQGFCVAAQPVLETEKAMTGCTSGDPDGLTISGEGVHSATWSSNRNPDVPDGKTVLRGHLIV